MMGRVLRLCKVEVQLFSLANASAPDLYYLLRDFFYLRLGNLMYRKWCLHLQIRARKLKLQFGAGWAKWGKRPRGGLIECQKASRCRFLKYMTLV